MTNTEIRDEQWDKIYSILKQHPRAYAGNEAECGLFYRSGALDLLRSGAQWRLLPEKYGRWNSVYKRFARWVTMACWMTYINNWQTIQA
jgi:transposase